jgi:hypothetical protein
MAVKHHAFGALLKAGNGASPEVFTTIASIADITGPTPKVDTIDTTTHDNPDKYKTFISGLREGGDVKCPIFFDPADTSHTGLITALEAAATQNYQIQLSMLSPTYKWAFAGLITEMGHTYKVNGAIMADVTIKVSGRPALSTP